jgi:hypothetical protein
MRFIWFFYINAIDSLLMRHVSTAICESVAHDWTRDGIVDFGTFVVSVMMVQDARLRVAWTSGAENKIPDKRDDAERHEPISSNNYLASCARACSLSVCSLSSWTRACSFSSWAMRWSLGLKYTMAHIATHITLHVMYFVAVGIDVYLVREGPVCASGCEQAELGMTRENLMCDAMDSDISLMFFLYAVAVGAATLKVVTIIVMLLYATNTVSHSLYGEGEWRECYTVCASWSVALVLDACLVSVSLFRMVVLRLQVSSYENDAFSASMIENWYVVIPMATITSILAIYDSIMFYNSRELCRGV